MEKEAQRIMEEAEEERKAERKIRLSYTTQTSLFHLEKKQGMGKPRPLH